MKKTTLLALLVLTTVLSTYAQKSSKFGIRAGWSSASMFENGSELPGAEPLNSFYIGVFKEYKLIPMLHAGGGLEYLQNGFEYKDIDQQSKLNYLSVPLYLKVKLGPVYATGGTALNFKVNESGVSPPSVEKSNVFDLPLQVGIGVKILMFSVEARYNWGLLEVYNNAPAKNQYLQVGAAVSF